MQSGPRRGRALRSRSRPCAGRLPLAGQAVRPRAPVRGNFGDPRTVFDGPPTRRTLMAAGGSFQFHFGIDISAPNGTAVYPVESGVVTTVTPEEIVVAGPAGRSFQYWHLHAAVHIGERVAAYSAFHRFYAYRQPGSYVFDLGTIAPAPGTYRVVVTASDIRGNESTRTSPLVVGAN